FPGVSRPATAAPEHCSPRFRCSPRNWPWPAPGSPLSRPYRQKCASFARRSSSRARSCWRSWDFSSTCCSEPDAVAGIPFDLQLLNLCAALLLLLSFAMLAQRRIVNLVNLLAVQGVLLLIATLLLAWRTGQHHLYLSAALTL